MLSVFVCIFAQENISQNDRLHDFLFAASKHFAVQQSTDIDCLRPSSMKHIHGFGLPPKMDMNELKALHEMVYAYKNMDIKFNF